MKGWLARMDIAGRKVLLLVVLAAAWLFGVTRVRPWNRWRQLLVPAVAGATVALVARATESRTWPDVALGATLGALGAVLTMMGIGPGPPRWYAASRRRIWRRATLSVAWVVALAGFAATGFDLGTFAYRLASLVVALMLALAYVFSVLREVHGSAGRTRHEPPGA